MFRGMFSVQVLQNTRVLYVRLSTPQERSVHIFEN